MNDERGIIFLLQNTIEKELSIVWLATVLQEWHYELNYRKEVCILIVSG